MPFVIKTLILVTSIAAAVAADKDALFKPGPAASYPFKQTNEKVTIAAVPFETEEQAKPAFGKLNPNKYGVLPVMLVIQNDSGQALFLEGLRVEYVAPDRTRIEATPPKDVPYLSGPTKPRYDTGPMPTGGPRVSRKKNPLAGGQIDVRAFSAQMLPPGDQASGFFYFQTGHRRGSKIYVTGIREAGTGKDVFYFEIPVE